MHLEAPRQRLERHASSSKYKVNQSQATELPLPSSLVRHSSDNLSPRKPDVEDSSTNNSLQTVFLLCWHLYSHEQSQSIYLGLLSYLFIP